MNILKYPTLEKAYPFLNKAIKTTQFIILIGECIIDYQGRAKSRLGLGERLVIVKPDRTLLVHRNGGARPVNWQPPGTIISFLTKTDLLVLKGIRRSPVETIKIGFRNISLIVTKKLRDKAVFDLSSTEIDMHQAIFEKPSLFEKGFTPLEREKKTAAGFVDIFGRDHFGNPVAIEVKKKPVAPEDIDQLRAYLHDLKKKYPGQKLRGVILGPSITKAAKVEIMKNKKYAVEFGKLTVEKCLKTLKKDENQNLSDYY
ncbi:MAG: endonuclease NucS [Candidatus Ranarchaeia archaeon]